MQSVREEEMMARMAAITGKPAYQQIVEDLTRRIQSGQLPPGAQLPSTAQMTQQYDVSTTVVRAAINQLQLAGLVIGQPGKGVFVREANSEVSPGSPEFAEVMQQLQAMRADLTDLNDRLARVEELTGAQSADDVRG